MTEETGPRRYLGIDFPTFQNQYGNCSEAKSLSVAGGHISFVLGARLSNGGRAITVLPPTARDGTVSRIMPALPLGTAVTMQRNTEYGVAQLRGKSAR